MEFDKDKIRLHTTPFIVEDHLETLEDVKTYLQEFINDGTLKEMKKAIDTAAKAKAFREMGSSDDPQIPTQA
jgi:DNA-binding phage protein